MTDVPGGRLDRLYDAAYIVVLNEPATVEALDLPTGSAAGTEAAQLFADPSFGASLIDPVPIGVLAAFRAAPVGSTHDYVARYLTRGGRTVWVHHRFHRELGDDGSALIRGIAWDSTTSKTAEEIQVAAEKSRLIGDAREALKASEEQFRVMAENSTDVVWRLDNAAVLRWVSPSVDAVLGWSADNLPGTRPQDLVHPEDHPRLMDQQVRVYAGVPSSSQVRFLTGDEEYRWMSVQARPHLDAAGEVVGAIIGVRDVHEEVVAQEALTRGERQFRLAMDGAPQGMALVALHTKFMQVNEKLCQLLDRNQAWLLDHRLDDILHPDDVEDDRGARDQLIVGGADNVVAERRLLGADGSPIWVLHSISLLRDEHGMPLFYVSQLQDITVTRQSREGLAASEKLFRLAMDGAPQGMAVIGLDLRFRRVNERLSTMVDRASDWLLAHTLTDILDVDDHQADQQARAKLLDGSAVNFVAERLLLTAEGGPVWVLHSESLLRDDRGQPLFYVSQFQDISGSRTMRSLVSLQTHDEALAGLMSRDKLLKRIETVFARRPRVGQDIAIVRCEVSGFAGVKSKPAQPIRDQIINTVAERISTSVRARDVVARIDAADFVVVLDGAHGRQEAEVVAAKIVAAVAVPVIIDGEPRRITLNVGVAIAAHGDDPTAALATADAALAANRIPC